MPPPPGGFGRHHAIGPPQNTGVGILAFERGGGGGGGGGTLSLIPKVHLQLGCWGGGGIRRARKLKNALQIITTRFNDPLQSVGQNQKWTTSGPSGYMHAFFVFSKFGGNFAVSRVKKKKNCQVMQFYFFAVNRVQKIIKLCNFILFAVNACTKKIVKSCNFILFFAVIRVMGVYNVPQKKNTRHNDFFVTRIYRKRKNYTNYNIHAKMGPPGQP